MDYKTLQRLSLIVLPNLFDSITAQSDLLLVQVNKQTYLLNFTREDNWLEGYFYYFYDERDYGTIVFAKQKVVYHLNPSYYGS